MRTDTATIEDELQRLRDEVRHLRAGIAAYRSVLSITGDRSPYKIGRAHV